MGREGIVVVWADDQMEFIETHRDALKLLEPKIATAAGGEDAVRLVRDIRPDLLLLDLQMPPGRWGGLWVLQELGTAVSDVPTVVLSGAGTLQECIQATRLGAADYVDKEKVAEELYEVVVKVLDAAAESRPATDYQRLRTIETRLQQLVMELLSAEAEKDGYHDVFRSPLIPREISLKTYERMLDGGGAEQKEYLDLLDLRKLIDRNWQTVERFRWLEALVRPATKELRTKWISDLNEARKIVMHPTRGQLDEEHRAAIEAAERIVDGWIGRVGGQGE